MYYVTTARRTNSRGTEYVSNSSRTLWYPHDATIGRFLADRNLRIMRNDPTISAMTSYAH